LGTVQYTDSSVKNTERPFHLNSEVNVAWGVDQIDTVLRGLTNRARPVNSNGCRVDSNASGTFPRVVVSGSITVMHLAHFVNGPGVIQNSLRASGLAGVNVRHDSDITDSIYTNIFHNNFQKITEPPSLWMRLNSIMLALLDHHDKEE
jgi:hypothetical protein